MDRDDSPSTPMRFYKTYVQGFDEALGGGIPKGHVMLISGPPGTMKSSLAYNILYQNAIREDIKGAYLTLEQSKSSLEFQLSRMGMDMERVEDRVQIQDLSRIRLGIEELRGKARFGTPAERPWLDVLKRHIEDVKEGHPFELLALDSLPVLEIISGLRERRINLFQFFGWLKGLGCTSFVISEVSPDPNTVHDEDFLADGLLYLTMEKVGGLDVYRRIRCVKMRGVNHSTGIYTLEFKEGGFKVSQVI